MEVARVRVEAPSLQMFWGTLIGCNTICTLKNRFLAGESPMRNAHDGACAGH